MDIFPTQYSTLSSKALNDFISNRYELSDTQCRLLIRNVSDTYVVESLTNKYIFKIYRDAHRKLEEIKGEVELLTILTNSGAKVSYPLKDLNGNSIQAFNAAEGTRYGVLFTYAKGGVVNKMSDQQLAVLGREMAAVHNVTAEIELTHKRHTFDIHSTIIDPLERIKSVFDELPLEYAWLNQTAKTVIAAMGTIDYRHFSHGYCHYDFLPKNFHFDEGNNLTFFDFDFAGKGYLVNDITSLYIHYFLDATLGRLPREEADKAFHIFVEHYRSTRPLHDEELKAMPYFGFAFWVFYLGFQFDNFDDWSSIFFNKKFLIDRVALIKKWMDYFEK
ncbi:phosphotransferase enzyme family protein [Mucilaginibacter xinganensis]|uniref:Aminoglycoside phosphotransferase domain-containing protein n=1 Tax=Mucilaginibacter xinganensis TaxID=1234841 RepID=A0A223NYQ2_9SPHI|nr:phosphotransferase [Mucilaginibacter xinganensis]ASU34910.1 hypothetical protein MuYL_3025 [Mucilaginibacter xinganensis]